MARKRRSRRRTIKFKLKKETARSITSITLIFVGIISLLSFFGQAVGIGVKNILSIFFGWFAILVPLIFILAGLVLTRRLRWSFVRLRTLIGAIATTLSLAAAVHFFLPEKAAYEQASVGEGGGLVGFAIQQFLRQHLSPLGAVTTLFFAAVTSILILLNTSLDSIISIINRIGDEMRALHNLILNKNNNLEKDKQEETKEEDELLNQEEREPQFITNPAKKDDEQEGEKSEGEFETFEIISPLGADAKTEDTTEVEIEMQNVEQESDAKTKPEKKGKRKRKEYSSWKNPPLSLLSESKGEEAERGDIKKNADLIEKTLNAFGVEAKVVEVNLGPAVTQYAIDLAEGTKVSKVVSLQNNLAMALAAPTGMVRIEAPIPGKALVGIEVPNYQPGLVTLKEIMSSEEMRKAKDKLTVALGHDVSGEPVITNITKMPHVLIAGTTGSGKSVLLNAFLATLLFRNSPKDLQLLLVDTKRVEFSAYNGMPHLLHPVIIEPEKVLSALKWAVEEMEKRYRILQKEKVKNLASYNKLPNVETLPYIIILVDELADLMSYSANEVEKAICRLAQMARAVGIHLVLATQRPSTEVLTGLIKANIPCRIAFQVASQVDSRVILDTSGAEKLMGKGDMLFLPPDRPKPLRTRGVYVSEKELNKLREYLKNSGYDPDYQAEVTKDRDERTDSPFDKPEDEKFYDAVEVVTKHNRASASLLQRRLRVGYARAARLLDAMHDRGLIGPHNGSNPREVLIDDASQIIAAGGDEEDEIS